MMGEIVLKKTGKPMSLRNETVMAGLLNLVNKINGEKEYE